MNDNKRRNSIFINGESLREHIEEVTGKTIYEVSREAGFSKNFLSESIRKGIASPTVQAVLKLNGIDVTDFEKKEETADAAKVEYTQLSFDDLETERERILTERARLERDKEDHKRAQRLFSESWYKMQKEEEAFKEGLAIMNEYTDKLSAWCKKYRKYLEG